jgi:putative transposase
VVSLAAKRPAARSLEDSYGVSERRACGVLALPRSRKRRQPGHTEQVVVVARIHTRSTRYPRFGYRKVYALLKAEPWHGSRETVHHIRNREGLQGVRKVRQRRPVGVSTTAPIRAERPNHVWSYDIVHDETTDGRRLKGLTVLDEHTRACLAISCARSITAGDVVRVLPHLCSPRGTPGCLKRDNGAEFVAKPVPSWLSNAGVQTHFLEPGSPWQNGHNDSRNAVFRDGCLDRWLFASVQDARCRIDQWRAAYNHERPHGALNGMTPAAVAAQLSNQREEVAEFS